jgi:hypothetical protein
MQYYKYLPNSDVFDGVRVDNVDHERVTAVHSLDEPIAGNWIPPVCHGFDDNPGVEGDFPSLSNFCEIPIFSRRAWEVLSPIVGASCEALPIRHPSGSPFLLIHVLETIDCLDRGKSEFRCYSSGTRIMNITRYGLNIERLQGRHIFKLPYQDGRDLLIDDEFRRVVEANQLRGLLFEELPR